MPTLAIPVLAYVPAFPHTSPLHVMRSNVEEGTSLITSRQPHTGVAASVGEARPDRRRVTIGESRYPLLFRSQVADIVALYSPCSGPC